MRRACKPLCTWLESRLLGPGPNSASSSQVGLENSIPPAGMERGSTERKEREPLANCKVLVIWGVIRRAIWDPAGLEALGGGQQLARPVPVLFYKPRLGV